MVGNCNYPKIIALFKMFSNYDFEDNFVAECFCDAAISKVIDEALISTDLCDVKISYYIASIANYNFAKATKTNKEKELAKKLMDAYKEFCFELLKN